MHEERVVLPIVLGPVRNAERRPVSASALLRTIASPVSRRGAAVHPAAEVARAMLILAEAAERRALVDFPLLVPVPIVVRREAAPSLPLCVARLRLSLAKVPRDQAAVDAGAEKLGGVP